MKATMAEPLSPDLLAARGHEQAEAVPERASLEANDPSELGTMVGAHGYRGTPTIDDLKRLRHLLTLPLKPRPTSLPEGEVIGQDHYAKRHSDYGAR